SDDTLRWFQFTPEGLIVHKQQGVQKEDYIYGPNNQILGWVGDLDVNPTSEQTPTKANFDPGIVIVNKDSLPQPKVYVVRSGDTFQSISAALYNGDPNHDFEIAMSIGYSPSDA